MRLTKTDKKAFVQAIIDDVPKTDYDEQCRSLMRKWGMESLPEELRQMAKKYPHYFATHYVYMPSGVPTVNVLCNPDWAHYGFKNCEPEKYAELKKLGELSGEQDLMVSNLRAKVAGLIEVCSTLNAAKERLPEFAKYLPADRTCTGTVNLPVSNVLADLTNLGWPKDAPLKAEAA